MEKICTEMKSTDRREDAANDEKKDEVGGCLKQEHNEYGPINFQQENSFLVNRSIKREQADDKTAVKQEDVRGCRQDQEDDSSRQSEGI